MLSRRLVDILNNMKDISTNKRHPLVRKKDKTSVLSDSPCGVESPAELDDQTKLFNHIENNSEKVDGNKVVSENSKIEVNEQASLTKLNTRRDSGIVDDLEKKSLMSIFGDKTLGNDGNCESEDICNSAEPKNNKMNTNTTDKRNLDCNTSNRLNNKILHLILSKKKLFRSASSNIEDFFNKDKPASNEKDRKSHSLKKKKNSQKSSFLNKI